MAAKRFYVLGAGNIGCLIAHSIRTAHPEAGITLCFPRLEKLKNFQHGESKITVERSGIKISQIGFDSEVPYLEYDKLQNLAGDDLVQHLEQSKIMNLIVTTKALDVRRALVPLSHRITRDSTILFVHNGMGVMDEVNRLLFPDPGKRPRMMFGVTNHGAHPKTPFHIKQVGFGSVEMGIIPREGEELPAVIENNSSNSVDISNYEESTQYLINSLLKCPDMSYRLNTFSEITCLQLEKLAANAVINALTVVFNCFNGELLYNQSVNKIMRLVLFEVSRVARSMPEVAEVPNKDLRFAPDTLEKVVISVLRNTAKNISSMLQDIRAGKSTEVDYINGFIANQGVKYGIPCAVNFMLKEMVHAKEKMVSGAKAASVPLVQKPKL